MTASRQTQRGAITLIGALFIVVVLSVMAAALLRMAGSNILDTAVHNDAVEALFVAETGVEHASYLYASTANCIGLAGVGPVNAGRGSFTLTNATVQPGGDCRVRVAASVGSAPNTAPAVRTVDADLRLGGGGEGWVVGDNGTILQWDGASWNAVASPTTNDLFAVHCVNASDCKAVGANGTIIHWDGASWSTVASSTTRDLFTISCEPDNPNNCFAAGGNIIFVFALSTIEHWDGTNWTNSYNNVQLFTDIHFRDLSCPSTTCYAVAANGSIRRYDPGSGNWVDDPSNTTVQLNGVACTADDYCWAVGDIAGNNWNFDFRNAVVWTPSTVNATNQADQNLNAVSCLDSSDCWAVGNADGNRYVLGQWDGASWTPNPFGNGAQRDNLNAVHCLATDDCWAVGDFRNGGNIIHYDGGAWVYIGATVANNTDLNGVHFPSGGGGGGSTITLTRWEEIIGN